MKLYQKMGITIEIEQEEYPLNPRQEFDNMATMYCEHRRYDLGDKDADTPYTYDEDEEGWADARKILRPDVALIAPLYLHDHGMIGMSAGQFFYQNTRGELFSTNTSGELRRKVDRDGWDHDGVGWIYLTRDTLLHEYGGQRVTKNKRARAIRYLTGEVETYNMYLTGDVHGYVIKDEDGEHLDSCWGFYGYEYCQQEAKISADYHAHKILESRLEDLAEEISGLFREAFDALNIERRLRVYL